jgi:hypothetical protein
MGAIRIMATVISPESTNPVSAGASPSREFDGDKIHWGTLKQPEASPYNTSAYSEFRMTNSTGRSVRVIVKETLADIRSSFSVQTVGV